MSKVNVIYVGTLPPHPGGSALSGVQLAGALARDGHRVRAVGPITRGTRLEADRLAAEYPAIEFHRFEVPDYEIQPDQKHGGEYRTIEGVALKEILPELVRREPPDVFFLGRETVAWHLPDPDVSGSIPCLLRVTGGGLNRLVEGLSPDGFEAGLKLPHGRVVPGRHMVPILEGIGCPNLQFIENPVDIDRFQPSPKRSDLLHRLRIDPNNFLVAHVSNLKPIKRPLDFVEAAGIVLEEVPDTTFLVVGDGPKRQELEGRCSELGIAESFRFTGWLDYADIPDLLCTIDIAVMCSEWEGMARVYLETMACERVLIASDIPPARELVDSGVNGLLFELGNVGALANSIIRAARDPVLRRTLGIRGRESIAAYSLDRVGAEYARVLRDLAGIAASRKAG